LGSWLTKRVSWSRNTDLASRRLSAKIDEQAKLRAHVDAEKKRNANPDGVFEVVKKYIEDFYRQEERKAERM
jgi:hypothetical protein